MIENNCPHCMATPCNLDMKAVQTWIYALAVEDLASR